MSVPGALAFVGGQEWSQGCNFDLELLTGSESDEVLVLPTAAAYEKPENVVLKAAQWFDALGGRVQGLMVVDRSSAQDSGIAKIVRQARFVYLSSGSLLHLRSVLKGSAVFSALLQAWLDGATIVGSGAGAMVLTDPMIDPRGGALSAGLGLLSGMAVIWHFGELEEDRHGEKLHRSIVLAPPDLPIVGIPNRTAVLRSPEGVWSTAGAGSVAVYLNAQIADEGLSILEKVVHSA